MLYISNKRQITLMWAVARACHPVDGVIHRSSYPFQHIQLQYITMTSKSGFPIISLFQRSKLSTLLGSFSCMPHRDLKFNLSNGEILSSASLFLVNIPHCSRSILSTEYSLMASHYTQGKIFKLANQAQDDLAPQYVLALTQPVCPFRASALSITDFFQFLPGTLFSHLLAINILLLPLPCVSAFFLSIV